MRHWPIKFVAGLGIVLSVQIVQADEVISPSQDKVAERTRSFIVTYKDHNVEHVTARYDGIVEKHVWQSGSASKPLKGHLADDRACHWDVSGLVKRQLMFTSESGVQAPYGVYEKIFSVTSSGGVGPKNFIQAAGFYHKTCGDAVTQYTNAINAAGKTVVDSFDKIVADDTAKEADEIRATLKAVRVSPSAAASSKKNKI